MASDVTLHVNARILSSLLEISHCKNLTLHFSTAPSVIQIDPDIDGLKVHFSEGSEPSTFIVAPRPPTVHDASLGLSDISVNVLDGSLSGPWTCVFVDAEGRMSNDLLITAGGRSGDQYKIQLNSDAKVDEVRRWTMDRVEKYMGGIPVLS